MYFPLAATGTAIAGTLSILSFLKFVPNYVEIFAHIDKQKDYNNYEANTRSENNNNSSRAFDFIIIGGGSAGLVVANRLVSTNHFNVLVLEAGGDPSPFMSIPFMQGKIIGTSYDYAYKTVRQEKSCLGMVDQKMKLPFGKALGGTSNINNMMYMRGCPKDYDHWAKLTNDEDWSYNNVLPYFKKSEDYHGNYEFGKVHSPGGNWYVGKLGYELPSTPTFFRAVNESGLPELDLNSNSSSLEGFMHADVNIKNGGRWGSYQAFLEPVLGNPNLTIYRYSKAIKVHLNSENRAVGVTYIRHGVQHYIEAKNEIIVSAGPIESPKLLLLSGIGPSMLLQLVGVSPVIDLPGVGLNLQDHVATSLGPILLNSSHSTFNPERDFSNEVIQAYTEKGDGPMSSTQFRIGLGYTVSAEFNDSAWPDIYCIVSGHGIDSNYGASVEKGLGGKEGAFESYFKPWIGSDAHQIRVILARPKSTGFITLASSNHEVPPLINPNYYAEDIDLKRMVEGIKFILNLYETSPAFQALNATFANNSFPGCEQHEFRSNEYWECYVKHFTMTMSHHCGACRMGSGVNDTNSVVDSKLRVLKVKNLRVIDVSVMPEVIIGNTNAPTVLIGEKGADYIIQEWMKK